MLLLLLPLMAGCGLTDLLSSSEFHELEVAPHDLSHQFVAHREGPTTATIHLKEVGGDGAVPWEGWTAGGAAWLALDRDRGTTPADIHVSLDPEGLEPGIHRDTIYFARARALPTSVSLPVSLEVLDPSDLECEERSTEPGAAFTDSLTVTSCEAHRGRGLPATRIALDPGPEDSLSFVLETDDFEAHLALLDSRNEVIYEADGCTPAVGDVCAVYMPRGEEGVHTVEVSSRAPDSFGAFTLFTTVPRAPDEPSGLVQRDGEHGGELTPGAMLSDRSVALEAGLTDPDPWDELRLEVELRFAERSFRGTATHRGRFGPQGTVELRIEELQEGRAYRWQARAVDPTGRSSPWSPFQPSATSDPDFMVEEPEPEEEPLLCDLANTAISDDVEIAPGASCTFENVQIDGNLTLHEGATLVARNVDVDGNLDAEGASSLTLTGSFVDGNLRFEEGGSAEILDTLIDGNLHFRSNHGALRLEDSTIDGTVQVVENSGGPFTLTGNEIHGNLQCRSNSPSPTGSGNTIHGNSQGQCATW